MLEKLSPVFPSRNLTTTEDFYAALGFRTVYREEDYLLLKRDGAELHFALTETATPATAFLRPSDLDAFAAEVAALGLPAEGQPRFLPPVTQPWGMRECLLVDPDGNTIRAAIEV
jgi:catechol 2,3-dioxygenase-like lactoylglutathione lyase family enzyme